MNRVIVHHNDNGKHVVEIEDVELVKNTGTYMDGKLIATIGIPLEDWREANRRVESLIGRE